MLERVKVEREEEGDNHEESKTGSITVMELHTQRMLWKNRKLKLAF